jgi:uncharacterized protein (TIGR03435 family)
MRGGALRGGRYDVRGATMVDLIGMAYRLDSSKIVGGPNWLDWDLSMANSQFHAAMGV